MLIDNFCQRAFVAEANSTSDLSTQKPNFFYRHTQR